MSSSKEDQTIDEDFQLKENQKKKKKEFANSVLGLCVAACGPVLVQASCGSET